jgi:hypothetical protein
MDVVIRTAVDAIVRFEEMDRAGWTAITARRQAWPEAKAILLKTLAAIVENAPKSRLGVHAFSAPAFEHFDGVQFQFGVAPTGITLRTSNKTAWGFEHGPALVFGQSESGLVVVVRFPAQTTLPGEERSSESGDFVEAIEPTETTCSLVARVTTEFIEWASSVTLGASRAGTRRPIGFLPQLRATSGGEPG